jgi:F420-0:gamma-glutamyl ligase
MAGQSGESGIDADNSRSYPSSALLRSAREISWVKSFVMPGAPLQRGDVVMAAQKIEPKAEGRKIPLASVSPSPEGHRLAAICGRTHGWWNWC